MAETDDLMKFFENVYVKDVPYCAICLRSKEEVRLSAPLVFRKILGALKYLDSFKNENICYMCEARASAMSRFVDMIQLALEIQIAFQRTLMSTGKKRRKRARENSDTYQSQFTKTRSQNDLHSTQILHIAGGAGKNSRQIGPKGTSEVIGQNNKAKQPEIETVIIDDDNQQDNINTDPVPNNINQNPTKSNNINSTPPVNISMGSDSYVYIMPVNNVLPSGTIYVLPNTSGNTQPTLDVNKSDTYKLPGATPMKKPRKTEKIDDDIEIVVESDIKTECKSEEKFVDQVVKLPVKKDPRVDWEDMIPMEVIACAEEKPVKNSTLKDAQQDLLKDLQNVINMGTS